MYAHQVIDDFEKILRQKNILDPMFRNSMNFVINNIKNAKHFFLGEFHDFKKPLETTLNENTPLFLNESSPFTRMPYQKCWFEFVNNPDNDSVEENVPRRGILAIEIKSDLIWVWIVNYMKSMKLWFLTPQAYYIAIGKTLSEDTLFLSMMQQKNKSLLQDPKARENIQKSNVFPIPISEGIDPEARYKMSRDDQRDMYVLNSALLLLNCKNIKTEDNFPPDKLNKKRKKNKKQELFTYKTLKLVLPASKNSTIDITDSTLSDSKRIHLCRGHFKIFTEDNPLFGKFTGVYWWQPHLRGNKDMGLVEKDYEIVTKA